MPKSILIVIALFTIVMLILVLRNKREVRITLPPSDRKFSSMAEAAGWIDRTTSLKVRAYSTFDFGRAIDESCRSVVIHESVADEFLNQLRLCVEQPLFAFIGTYSWLGEETHSGVEVVLAELEDQFGILNVARTDAVNYNMLTDDIVKKLKSIHDQFGIVIRKASTDTVEFSLDRIPDDLNTFSKQIYDFCPDVVDQGSGSVEAYADEIRQTKRVFLWWD